MAVYPSIETAAFFMFSAPLVAFLLGVAYSYEVRKVFARLQSRRGPWFIVPSALRSTFGFSRTLQPLYDILKLLYKETLVPKSANKQLFKFSPYLALVCLIIATWFIPLAGYSSFGAFEFSLVVVLYLLLAVPIAFILGGAGSSSPWGVLGGRREAELMLAYEVPLVIGIFSTAIMANSLSLAEIVSFQTQRLPFIFLNPFAAIAVFSALVGKLHLKPFDIPEADVEIVAGPITEYSGKLLGIVEAVRAILVFACVALFTNVFLQGGLVFSGYISSLFSAILFIVQGFIITFLISLVHAANPRYRIDQAFAWYTRIPLAASLMGLVWAYAVKYMFPTLIAGV